MSNPKPQRIQFLDGVASDSRLSSMTFHVAYAMSSFANTKDKNTWSEGCYFSMDTIAKRIGVSVRTVHTEITKLKNCGYLTISRYHNGYRINHYCFITRSSEQFSRAPGLIGEPEPDTEGWEHTLKSEQTEYVYPGEAEHRKQASGAGIEHRKQASCAGIEHWKQASYAGIEHRKPASGVGMEHRKQASCHTGSLLPTNNINEKYSLSSVDHSGCGMEERLSDGWSRFFAAFPFHDGMPAGDARREFDHLNGQDQETAIAGAAVYAATVKSRGTLHPTFAAKWLRDREFDRVGRRTKVAPDNSAAPSSVFVEKDTPEWRAWCEWKGKSYPTSTGVVDGRRCDGWSFPSRWPPPDHLDHAVSS